MRPWPALLLPFLLALAAPSADAKDGPGPGKPIRARPALTDAHLFAKAERIQGRMWWHLSPEGLLVERHRPGADAAQLDHAVLSTADAAIWTGCYAASQVMRWRVTGDPDALDQVRTLARGLAALSDAAGKRGRLLRSVGRVLPGHRPPPKTLPSPRRDGRYIRSDVSRDQLAGVTLGWFWIGRYMEGHPDLQAMAALYLGDIAKRLALDDMWLRDVFGRKTEHGELRKNLSFMPVMKNGVHAAIALATVLGAATLNPGDETLRNLARGMLGDGWPAALDDQHTFVPSAITSSNVFMTVISLLVIARVEHEDARQQAGRALGKLRRATVGWWNAGLCACFLVAGMDHPDVVAEVRATLDAMPEDPTPPVGTQILNEDEIVPIRFRTRITGWAWKEDVKRRHAAPVDAPPNPNVTFTRADWLFAYWMARGAGKLRPEGGPGAVEGAVRIGLDLPPWRRPAPQPERLPSFGFGGDR